MWEEKNQILPLKLAIDVDVMIEKEVPKAKRNGNSTAVDGLRRFSVVEKRWRTACMSENEKVTENSLSYFAFSLFPSDLELAAAFVERKQMEGSVRGFGIRVSQSSVGLYINKEEEGDNNLLWPLILHIKGSYCILVLPLVEPRPVKAYARLCQRSDCGNAVGADESLSSLLLDLPSITGAFMVAHAIGDIVAGNAVEPEVLVSASPSVGGLLDSLTGSIGISGISSRAIPVAAPVASSIPSSTTVAGAVAMDTPKIDSRPLDKDALRTFISSSMSFGTPLDLSYSNISAIKVNGFSSSDLPPVDLKQPAWKPYLYKGKPRMLFSIHETVHAAMYDQDEIPDNISVSSQINCRAELEGLPDVLFPLTGLNAAHVEVLSFHPCAQVSERGVDKQAVMFSPPLGNFILLRYQASCGHGPPIKGFYQLSMVSEDKGAFLFKLRLMEGYKSPLTMEFCTVSMPFPRRRVVSFDGTPSIGTLSTTEHSVEWKIVSGGRGLSGKSIEATFPGTVNFAPWQAQRLPSSRSFLGSIADEDSDVKTQNSNNMVNMEEFIMEKLINDLPPVDLKEPFCWQAYNYAKVTSGNYILWNTLGKCPSAAAEKL
ncbi:hypothetical protein ACJW31_04G000100 [Castanea mollissima]